MRKIYEGCTLVYELDEHTTYGAMDSFKELLKEFSPNDFIFATLLYNVNHCTNYDSPSKDWPLIFKLKDNTEIRVICATGGYGGAGPNMVCDMLQLAEFNFNKMDIYSRDEFGNCVRYYQK